MCNKARPNEFLNEIRMFSLMDSHPYISKCHAIMSDNFRIIMTKYKADCFQAFIYNRKKIKNDDYLRFIYQMSNALLSLHNQGICHADIKPENILVDLQNNFFLTDFGLSSYPVKSNSGIRRIKGTPEYLPPEQLMQSEYGYLSDVWSFGMVCYELCCGYMCFYIRSIKQYKKMIDNNQIHIHFKDRCGLTNEQKGLINKMLKLNPMHRVSFSEILVTINT